MQKFILNYGHDLNYFMAKFCKSHAANFSLFLAKSRALGQTTVEYILIIAVLMSIVFTALHRLQSQIIGQDDSFVKKIISELETNFSDGHVSGKYKKYHFHR